MEIYTNTNRRYTQTKTVEIYSNTNNVDNRPKHKQQKFKVTRKVKTHIAN